MTRLSGGDPLLRLLIDNKVPLDRETYLGASYVDEPPPDPYPAEREDVLPAPFRKDRNEAVYWDAQGNPVAQEPPEPAPEPAPPPLPRVSLLG